MPTGLECLQIGRAVPCEGLLAFKESILPLCNFGRPTSCTGVAHSLLLESADPVSNIPRPRSRHMTVLAKHRKVPSTVYLKEKVYYVVIEKLVPEA